MALLQISVSGPLLIAAECVAQSGVPEARTIVSISPFGQPSQSTSEFHFYSQAGQSGSPVFRAGALYGLLARGSLELRLDGLIYRPTIDKFIDGLAEPSGEENQGK